MAIGHDEAVGTDDRLGAIEGTGVDGGALADDGAGTDFHVGHDAGLPLKVLGLGADAGAGEDLAPFAQRGVSLDGRMMMELDAGAKRDIGTNIGERPNLGGRVDLGTFTDKRKGTDGHGRPHWCLGIR